MITKLIEKKSFIVHALNNQQKEDIMSGSTRLKRLLLVATMVFLLPMYLFAGNTGKITGVVKDKESGDALPGVNILIEGTSMGATTNAKGEYTILNVPAGVYTVATSMIGYTKLTKQNVRVIPDFTTRLDFEISATSVTGEEQVVVAERPLIQKDQTMTMSVTTAEEIKNLPVRGFQAAANLGVGIVVSNARNLDGGTANVNIRGGRSSETGVYMDGFQQNNLLTGTSNANVPSGAVEEVQVITGGFDAEYGRNQSGIIQVTTKSGGQRYSGNIEAVGDPAGLGIAESYGYKVLSGGIGGQVIPGNNTIRFFVSAEAREIDDAEPSVWGYPEYSISKALSPANYYDHDGDPSTPTVPKDTVTWKTNKDGSVKYKKGARPDGVAGAGINSDKGVNLQAKVTFDAIPNKLRIDLTGNFGQTIRRNTTVARTLAVNDNLRREISNLNVGTIATYTLDQKSFVDFGINYFSNTRKLMNDLLGFDNVYDYRTRQLGSTGAPTYFNRNVLQDVNRGSLNYRQDVDQYIAFKGNYTNQIDKHNQVKIGADFFRHTIRYLNIGDIGNPITGSNDNIGYKLVEKNGKAVIKEVNSDDLENKQQGPPHPISLSLFGQDKLEYEGLVIRGGLRLDVFNPGVKRVRNIGDPTGSKAEDQQLVFNDLNLNGEFDRASEIATDGYTDRNDNGNYDEGTDRLHAGSIGAEDYTNAKNDVKISPRFSVSFPISEKTQFRMSYGKFFQQPNLQDLYVSPYYLEGQSTLSFAAATIGNPNLVAEKSTQYEVGIRRALTEKVALDINAYYKDITGLVNSKAVPSEPTGLIIYDNEDQGVVQGVNIGLEVRRVGKFSGRVNYTLQSATGSGSGTNSGFRAAWLGFSDTKFNAPLNFDQRHNINASLDVRNGKGEGPSVGGVKALENAGLNFLVSAGSGFPYTPTTSGALQVFGVPANKVTARRNSQNQPWTFRIDMKADKTFYVSDNMNINVYVQVLNLLDRKNVLVVYPSTGRADDNGFLDTEGFNSTYATQAIRDQVRPQYDVNFHDGFSWDTPRQARLGILFNF